jgi:hypothetical protein
VERPPPGLVSSTVETQTAMGCRAHSNCWTGQACAWRSGTRGITSTWCSPVRPVTRLIRGWGAAVIGLGASLATLLAVDAGTFACSRHAGSSDRQALWDQDKPKSIPAHARRLRLIAGETGL